MFDQCPGFWRRTDETRWGVLPHVSGGKPASTRAYDLRFAVDKGTADLLTLPGKAYDAVLTVLAQENQKIEAERATSETARGRARR